MYLKLLVHCLDLSRRLNKRQVRNSTEGGAWQATVAKIQTRLSDLTLHVGKKIYQHKCPLWGKQK